MPDEQRTANNSQTYVVYASEFSYETLEQENGQATVVRFQLANPQYHAGDVVGVQREDGRAGDECKRGGLGVPGRHRTHLAHSLCEE